MKTPRRLHSENVTFVIGQTPATPDGHIITVNIGYDSIGRVIEVAMTEEGKLGQGFDLLIAELGMKLSRVIQDRNPESEA